MNTKKIILACTFLILNSTINCWAQAKEWGKNIISILPMQIVGNGGNNTVNETNDGTDINIGLAYERVFKNEHLSVKIPFSFSINNPGYYYIMPTAKLYPTGQGIVKYAIGPQFYIGTGKIKHTYTIYNSYPYYTSHDSVTTVNKSQLGFMINNSLNVTILDNIYMGIDLGLGVFYYDSENKNSNNQSAVNPFDPAVQINFSMGYRF